MSEEMGNVLTFSELRKKQKKEDKQEDLLELDDSFLLRASNYFQQKKDTEGESREYKNARRVLDKIISLREEKIVKKARLSSNTDLETSDMSLLPEEQELFRDMKNSFNNHHDKIDDKVESTEKGLSKQEEEINNTEEDNLEASNKESSQDESVNEEPKEDNDSDTESREGYSYVKIKSGVPEFMGTDLEAYGPFEAGDEVEVPDDNAEILINRGNAESLEG